MREAESFSDFGCSYEELNVNPAAHPGNLVLKWAIVYVCSLHLLSSTYVDTREKMTSATRIPANKGKTFPIEILTPDEVRALIRACSATSSAGIRNRALITLLYRTGLRCSEALYLMPKDINFEIGAGSVLRGKGGRRRTVGIDAGALEVIDKWLGKRMELRIARLTPLFCSLSGRALSGSYVRTLLPRLARQVGIEKRVHPHGLRHTHAFELLNEGVPLPIIQRQLGHMSLQTTDAYVSHFAPVDVVTRINGRTWSV
jgi:site-specific recombinase XerD